MVRAAIFVFLGLCLGVLNASGQAIPAGRAGRANASIGYSYVNAPLGGSGRTSLNGLDAGLALRLRSRFGIEGNVGYFRSGNPRGIPGHSDILSYMGGPFFYLSERGRFQTTAHVLLGGARVSAPVPVSGGILVGGWATGFAWATGAAADYRFSTRFAVRTSVDYLSTSYFSPSLAIQRQSDVRLGVSLVYLFASSSGRRR